MDVELIAIGIRNLHPGRDGGILDIRPPSQVRSGIVSLCTDTCTMNFLAHLYLSGPPGEIMIGNFIADSVTSKMQTAYAEDIQKGISLHRKIDSFTDTHSIVAQSKERLRKRYKKYAPVIVDIFYDHFLASQWENYSAISLREYADTAYHFLGLQTALFPERSRRFFHYMVNYDMLYNYSKVEGIERVMKGMSGRASFNSGMETSTEELILHYEQFNAEFRLFFPELIRNCQS
jgi:acyl carrier protein phosphodiesterase